MSATVGAALKKVAVYLLQDKKALKFVGGTVLVILIVILMPIIIAKGNGLHFGLLIKLHGKLLLLKIHNRQVNIGLFQENGVMGNFCGCLNAVKSFLVGVGDIMSRISGGDV